MGTSKEKAHEYYLLHREDHLAYFKEYKRNHAQEIYESTKNLQQRKRKYATDERKALIFDLARARFDAGMSQREVAELVSVSTSFINKYESLAEIPSQERLQRWCKILDVEYRETEPLKEEYYQERRRRH